MILRLDESSVECLEGLGLLTVNVRCNGTVLNRVRSGTRHNAWWSLAELTYVVPVVKGLTTHTLCPRRFLILKKKRTHT